MSLGDKIWLKDFMGYEEILCNSSKYDLEKNIDIQAIIFTNQAENAEILAFIHKICQACGLQEHTYKILTKAYPIPALLQAYGSLKYIFNYGLNAQEIVPSLNVDALDKVQLNNLYFINVHNIIQVYQDATIKAYYWNTILKPIFSK